MATMERSKAGAAIETTIDYLLPTSTINRRFWAPGKEFNTGIYQPYPVTIRNARLAAEPPTLANSHSASGQSCGGSEKVRHRLNARKRL